MQAIVFNHSNSIFFPIAQWNIHLYKNIENCSPNAICPAPALVYVQESAFILHVFKGLKEVNTPFL